MFAGRPSLLVSGRAQWDAARHDRTVVAADGGVGLAWELLPLQGREHGDDHGCSVGGMAVDRHCRVYVVTTSPAGGNVERVLLGDARWGVDYADVPDGLLLFDPPHRAGAGSDSDTGFRPSGPGLSDPALVDPIGVAVDPDDRLFVAERGRRRIDVIDLWSRRVLRVVPTADDARPLRAPSGLAADGRTVWVVVQQPSGLLRLTARTGPIEVDLPPALAGRAPERVAVVDGLPVLLARDPAGVAWLIASDRPAVELGDAIDLTSANGEIVVSSCGRLQSVLRRFRVEAERLAEIEPLDAAGYDGRGLAATSDHDVEGGESGPGQRVRVAYTTAKGIRLATSTRVRYRSSGAVTTSRLDSGTPGARWGRLFVDACLPIGSSVTFVAHTTDDDALTAIVETELTSGVVAGDQLLARADHPEPWVRHSAATGIVTLEGYLDVPPGRYIWLTLRLTGDARSTPTVRSIRIEAETHGLTRRLPRVFDLGAEPGGAPSFLHRYLALADGMLHDLDRRSRARELLVDPASAPEEALPWLASFVGLVLDDRWTVPARRQLIAEAIQLYHRRGTIWALSRYLEIYLGVSPVIVEHHRLRGVGGPLVGPDNGSRSVLGLGFRVGGAVGREPEPGTGPETGAGTVRETALATSFALHAHRFSVMVPRPLEAEQEAVVRHVLDTERPAHTAYELCTVDAGMRVGRNLHLALSSVVGATGGFVPLLLDRSVLGRGTTLGVPTAGAVVEASRAELARVG